MTRYFHHKFQMMTGDLVRWEYGSNNRQDECLFLDVLWLCVLLKHIGT
jgi:hypothetical protein